MRTCMALTAHGHVGWRGRRLQRGRNSSDGKGAASTSYAKKRRQRGIRRARIGAVRRRRRRASVRRQRQHARQNGDGEAVRRSDARRKDVEQVRDGCVVGTDRSSTRGAISTKFDDEMEVVSSRAVIDRRADDVAWLGDASGEVAVPGLSRNLGPSQLVSELRFKGEPRE
ncbi:hypothetical protein Scep_018792 [Stephania cephalantha]|uniref:Uncharacterized protein n=1 Tax=Stephania cephalantha TaxID=152367 RepID=A0AAP0IA10_9MAGN